VSVVLRSVEIRHLCASCTQQCPIKCQSLHTILRECFIYTPRFFRCATPIFFFLSLRAFDCLARRCLQILILSESSSDLGPVHTPKQINQKQKDESLTEHQETADFFPNYVLTRAKMISSRVDAVMLSNKTSQNICCRLQNFHFPVGSRWRSSLWPRKRFQIVCACGAVWFGMRQWVWITMGCQP